MARYAFITLHLKGHENVNERLQRFPDVMRGRIVGPALRAGAKIVQERVRALAPSRTGRLRGGRWTLKAFTNRRRHTRGIRVVTPTRAELGIPDAADGFYPTSQEFGWRVGRQVAGPLDLGARVLKKNRKGRLYRANERTVAEARLSLNEHRRKIAGRRYMHAALFGASGQVVAAVAAEALRRMEKIDLARASAGTEE